MNYKKTTENKMKAEVKHNEVLKSLSDDFISEISSLKKEKTMDNNNSKKAILTAMGRVKVGKANPVRKAQRKAQRLARRRNRS